MKKDNGNSFRFVLRDIIVPIAALLATMSVLFTVFNIKLGEAAKQRAYKLLSDSSGLQNASMEERIKGCFQQLDIIAAGIDWKKDIYSDESVLRDLKSLNKNSQFVNLAITDRGGKLLYQNGNIADCSDRSYIKEALRGEASSQFLSKGRMSGDAVFVFAAPVYADNEVIGAVVATRNLKDISNELGDLEFNDNQYNFLCYGDGEIIAIPGGNEFPLQVGDNVDKYFKSDTKISDIDINEVYEYKSGSGEYYGIFVPSGLENIYIFSLTTVSYALSLAGLYSKWSAVLALAIFAITFIAALIIIFKLRQRIRAAEAEELERRNKLEEYHKFQNRRSLGRKNVFASYHLNLTKNQFSCNEDIMKDPNFKGSYEAITTAEEFLNFAGSYLFPDDKKLYNEIMTRDSLIRAYENGKTTVQHDFMYYASSGRYTWLRMIIDLVRNPITGDLEAIAYSVGINREKRLEQIGKKIIAENFEAVGLIDVKSGRLFGAKEAGEAKVKKDYDLEDGVEYDAAMRRIMGILLTENDYEYVKEEMKFSKVIKGLEKSDVYSLTTSLYSKEKGVNGCFKINYSYLDSRKESIIVSCEDITDILASKTDIETGLYNSTGFYEKIEEWLKENPGKKYRIYRYNIDGFNDINGTYGYETGNRLLIDIGKYMRMRSNENSFAAHLTADHFVRFCTAECETAEEHYNMFLSDFSDYDLEFPLSIHVGVYDLCEENCSVLTMTYKAYIALQSVKEDLTKHIGYYKEGLMQATKNQQMFLAEMKKALAEEQFEVWFQPQFNYEDKSLTGAEALVRWNYPGIGIIPPGEFIPLFERSRQITMLDIYVWEKSCRYIRYWKDKGIEMPVSVNVSRIDIQNPEICGILLEQTRKYNIEPKLLKLEITESAYLSETEVLKSSIKSFKDAGFTIEMDDFGAGYSSLNILKDLDIDVLKLDKQLVSEIGVGNEKSDNILRFVIMMAKALNIDIIAEGVKTEGQAEFLKSVNCFNMQGFYFAKPMTAEEFENFAKNCKIGKMQ